MIVKARTPAANFSQTAEWIHVQRIAQKILLEGWGLAWCLGYCVS